MQKTDNVQFAKTSRMTFLENLIAACLEFHKLPSHARITSDICGVKLIVTLPFMAEHVDTVRCFSWEEIEAAVETNNLPMLVSIRVESLGYDIVDHINDNFGKGDK